MEGRPAALRKGHTAMPRVLVLLPLLLALVLAAGDLGSGMDPNGRPEMTSEDRGSIMDPNG
jgi:hypothetical protein